MERSSRRVLGILSDCDGVIVDSEMIADAILAEMLQTAFGRQDLGAYARDLFGRRLIDIIQLMEERAGHAFSPAERSRWFPTAPSRAFSAASSALGCCP
jgi:beta-phosphoglucomutase-like phosphatase (HAD superfamily)